MKQRLRRAMSLQVEVGTGIVHGGSWGGKDWGGVGAGKLNRGIAGMSLAERSLCQPDPAKNDDLAAVIPPPWVAASMNPNSIALRVFK